MSDNENDIAAKEKELNDRLSAVIASLSDYEKKDVGAKIDELLKLRLSNEYVLYNALLEGWKYDKITAENLKKLLNSGKDSVGDLVKLVQLLGGKPTEIRESRVAPVDIEERAKQLAEQRNRISSIN